MKTALGTEVDLGPGHNVLYRRLTQCDPAALRKGHNSLPSFRLMSVVARVAHISYCWALVLMLSLLQKKRRNKKVGVTMDIREVVEIFTTYFYGPIFTIVSGVQ